MRPIPRISFVIGTLLWLFVVIVFFYWGHQAVVIPLIIGLVRLAWQMLVVTLVGVTAWGWGQVALIPFQAAFASARERTLYALPVGVGLMSLVTLGLGFIGWLSGTVFWLLTGGTVLGVMVWWLRHRGRTTPPSPPEPFTRFDRFLLTITGLSLGTGLLISLPPPIGWDALSIHLVVVREALKSGELFPSLLMARPLAGHLLFIWGMGMGGDIIPQLLSYGQALWMVWGVWVFGNQYFNRRVALLGVTILASVELFIITSSWPYIDAPVSFLATFAMLALARWLISAGPGATWLLMAAFLSAAAAHTKLNGLFVLPVMAVGVALGLWWHRGQWRERLPGIVAAGLLGLSLMGIWTVAENGLQPQTPVTTLDRVAGEVNEVVVDTNEKTVWEQLRAYIVVIWEMTILGQQGGLNYDGTITPFFLIFIPPLLLLPRKEKLVVALLVLALTTFLLWLVIPKYYYQTRHLMLAFPLLSLLTAYIIDRLPEFDLPQLSLYRFTKIILVVVFCLQWLALLDWYQIIDPTAYILGFQSREDYLLATLNEGVSPGYYSMILYMNEHLPEESVVGFAYPEPRVYYCEFECIRFPFGFSATVEQMREAMVTQQVEYLLVDTAGIAYFGALYEDDPVQREAWETYQRELNTLLLGQGTLLHQEEDSFALYKMNP